MVGSNTGVLLLVAQMTTSAPRTQRSTRSESTMSRPNRFDIRHTNAIRFSA